MAVIILAGGMSTRMRQDKASLVWGHSTVLTLLVARFMGQFGHVIVVQRPDQGLALPVDVVLTSDIFPDCGPLGGIHAGLAASPDDANMVVACDMPFASPDLAGYILSLLDNRHAAVPMLGRGPEPLFAAYRRSILPQVESNLTDGALKLRILLESVDTLYVPEDDLRQIDPELRCFRNVNTPQDYDELLREG